MRVDTFLLEIGTEELPPKSLRTLSVAFANAIEGGLRDANLEFAEVKPYATPRRLAVLVDALNDTQPDQDVERRGPSVSAAYDDGQPTQALQGFAKSCGVTDLNELETLKTDKGEWVVYRATKPGERLDDLLPEIAEDALANLPIPRRMRWGAHRAEFARPVQWLCALHGKRVVPLELFGHTAGKHSQGHRFMSSGPFALKHANDYVKACRKHKVLVDFAERSALIERDVQAKAAALGAHCEIDPELLDEVTALVEWPVAISGTFEEAFLEVPPEVLISAMKKHQRYFHLVDDKGALVNRFIAVANIESKNPDVVVQGNERVIRPRLADAAFFYKKDAERRLEDRVADLANVTWHAKLGSYKDKTERLSKLAVQVAEKIEADVDLEAAERAATLCKADLTTDMVGEFPDLQGIMGGYYAARDGEPEGVCQAIAQHYRPTHSGAELPHTLTGRILALADKLDTLKALLGIGEFPSGSQDPYGLRRQALGAIRICIEGELDLDPIGPMLTAYPPTEYEGVYLASDYIIERSINWYADQNIGRDVVEAVRNGSRIFDETRANRDGIGNLWRADKIIRTLHAFKSDPIAEQVIAANKRVANILSKDEPGTSGQGEQQIGEVNPALLQEEAEQALNTALNDASERMKKADAIEDKLQVLASLQPAIDRFFDEVLVMAEEPDLRDNRRRLLSSIREHFLQVADFSLLQ